MCAWKPNPTPAIQTTSTTREKTYLQLLDLAHARRERLDRRQQPLGVGLHLLVLLLREGSVVVTVVSRG